MPKPKGATKLPQPASKRSYLSQEDVPANNLENALRVARTLGDNFGYKPTAPLLVAQSLDMMPGSSTFRMLCGSSIAYGLTTGGYNANEIALTELGLKIVRPTDETDEPAARREALLKPRVVGEFLRKYDKSPLPRQDIAQNVLSTFGVPSDKLQQVFELIVDGAASVGFLKEIKDKKFVFLNNVIGAPAAPVDQGEATLGAEGPEKIDQPAFSKHPEAKQAPVVAGAPANRRVFITHGKNHVFVEPIKKLLGFGQFEPVVSVDRQSVSQPVPDKVMNDMRSCSAAIIHVDAEIRVTDAEGKEHVFLNPNVLIEIGAAMALYGRQFILLVRDGVKLPSNLQGLYEVRYANESLDAEATIRLMEAINELKKAPSAASVPGPS